MAHGEDIKTKEFKALLLDYIFCFHQGRLRPTVKCGRPDSVKAGMRCDELKVTKQ